MNSLLGAWLEWMAAMTWQSGLLALVVLILDRSLPDTIWPQIRHGLWSLVALKLVLPPDLPALWRPPVAAASEALPTALPTLATLPSSAMEGTALGAAVGGLGPSAWSSPALWLAALWLTGLALLAVRAWVHQYRFHRAVERHAEPSNRRLLDQAAEAASRLHLRRIPRVVTLAASTNLPSGPRGPFVTGLLRPTVILPASAPAWGRSVLSHVLLHELAHLKRRDLWRELAFSAVATVYWFLPWAHRARRRAREEREILCDATAARAADGSSYATTLLRLGAAASNVTAAGATAGFGVRRALLLRRLDALDRGAGRDSRWRTTGTAIALAVVAVLALPMAAPTSISEGASEVLTIPFFARTAPIEDEGAESASLALPKDLLPPRGVEAQTTSATSLLPTVGGDSNRERQGRETVESPPGEQDSLDPLRQEIRDARDALARTAADPAAGSLHKRYAALRLVAAQARLAEPPPSEESGRSLAPSTPTPSTPRRSDG